MSDGTSSARITEASISTASAVPMPFSLMKMICDVAKAMIHGRLIADKPDARAAQQMRLLQPLDSQHDASSAI